jgi:hypothetical protein
MSNQILRCKQVDSQTRKINEKSFGNQVHKSLIVELDQLLFLGACNLLARDGRMATATAERRAELIRLAIGDASQVWNTLVEAQKERWESVRDLL